MTLSKETVDEIENKFKEIMEILNVMDAPETNTNDDPIDENEEALKFIEQNLGHAFPFQTMFGGG